MNIIIGNERAQFSGGRKDIPQILIKVHQGASASLYRVPISFNKEAGDTVALFSSCFLCDPTGRLIEPNEVELALVLSKRFLLKLSLTLDI
jgi:hypothetical protein